MKDSKSLTTQTGPEHSGRRKRLKFIVLTVIVVFLVLVVIAQWLPKSPLAAEAPAASTGAGQHRANELPVVRRAHNDPMAIGDVNAPVVLVLWTDFRCPFCAVFNRQTLPTLIQEYVDTGRVRIEVHDVTFFGQYSQDAAVAAHAAGEQGRFFEFMAAVYAEAPEGGHPDFPRDTLIAFARKAGVPDIQRFTADLDRPALVQAVQDNTATAQALGVNSVPFFVAGNIALAGAQPMEVFRSFLEEALKKAEETAS
ncbi:protein-disulfide isomerase [Deinobacterium chartae]|uniref:Protein-disulfide isomerase n=1 Tax=Deinobacterium chartae TaxID=521158 RepID=A0A841I307_9DEIO|nr:thioredoxin domain-containing protein [Deinobacterium chartae]MBB6099663.1 protein-disulfide isomerase [Deinobacterium chartae]